MHTLNTTFSPKSNTACNNNLFSCLIIGVMHESTKRLYEAAGRLKGIKSPSELALALNTSVQTVHNWEDRGISKEGALLVQEKLWISATWIRSAIGPVQLTYNLDNQGKSANVINENQRPYPPGPEFKAVKYGTFRLEAGIYGFAIDYDDEDLAPLYFREDWLSKKGLKSENLTARTISGESMSPGLNDGDTVLIDVSRCTPIDGRVFAVNYEGEFVIKRLIRDAGQWWLSSDNTDKTRYPNKLCSGDLCIIIGEIVHKQSTFI